MKSSAVLERAMATLDELSDTYGNVVPYRGRLTSPDLLEASDGPTLAAAALAWPEPQPLCAQAEPQSYPLDALPPTLRAAVEEVQRFTQAPIPLVVSSALAALSLAVQAHVDVKRAEGLAGPVGLYLLTIANSGERKSSSDGYFTRAIREYEAEQAELAKPALAEHNAVFAAWEAKTGGVKEAIRQAAKSGKPTLEHEHALRMLEREKPEFPRVPRLVYGDTTPEALKWSLATGWPAGGVVSSEAGIVLGSHGMSGDSVMRNLATLNELWDGKDIATDRRGSESFTVRGARMTVGLQVQEAALQSFIEKSGTLARGTGFLARFLLAWPESTQGTRFFTEAPDHWPALDAFNRRIAEILSAPVAMEHGALMPATVSLDPAAKLAWIAFHDSIERELSETGELRDVRDVASKSAENAARLAALFQFFEDGVGSAVGVESLESACRVALWHLMEARRFFTDLAVPEQVQQAIRLDAWLIARCAKDGVAAVPTTAALQYGPAALRSKNALETALRELADLGRARVATHGRKRVVEVNPALLVDCGLK